jgi:hypothetical protein
VQGWLAARFDPHPPPVRRSARPSRAHAPTCPAARRINAATSALCRITPHRRGHAHRADPRLSSPMRRRPHGRATRLVSRTLLPCPTCAAPAESSQPPLRVTQSARRAATCGRRRPRERAGRRLAQRFHASAPLSISRLHPRCRTCPRARRSRRPPRPLRRPVRPARLHAGSTAAPRASASTCMPSRMGARLPPSRRGDKPRRPAKMRAAPTSHDVPRPAARRGRRCPPRAGTSSQRERVPPTGHRRGSPTHPHACTRTSAPARRVPRMSTSPPRAPPRPPAAAVGRRRQVTP